MKKFRINEFAEYIDGFLSQSECRNLISLAEEKGFQDAMIVSDGKQLLAKEIRNNTRVIIDDFSLSSDWWARLKPGLGISLSEWNPVGLNERFRFYRYENYQMFRLHRDYPYENGESISFLSLIIYLNDEFEGGQTEFKEFSIAPKTGRAAIFKHDLLHQGNAVTAGIKYAVRTDVMFRRSV